jgi:peptidoglycan/xylan/chitin deacetylase (PgdA/CDA1 family)
LQNISNSAGSGPRILLYHRVADLPFDPQLLAVKPERFADHIDILQKHYILVSVYEMLSAVKTNRDAEKMIAITFDDGYADILHNVSPILSNANVPGIVFVTSAHLGTDREFWWDELERLLLLPGRLPETINLMIHDQLTSYELREWADYDEPSFLELCEWNVLRSDDPTPRHALYRSLHSYLRPMIPSAREKFLDELSTQLHRSRKGRESHRILTDRELQKLQSEGAVEIGGHTVNHPVLSTLPVEAQREEISEGNLVLAKILGKGVRGFSYPYGGHHDFSSETIRIVRDLGLEFACANFEDRFHAGTDPYILPRYIVRNWTADEFINWLNLR